MSEKLYYDVLYQHPELTLSLPFVASFVVFVATYWALMRKYGKQPKMLAFK